MAVLYQGMARVRALRRSGHRHRRSQTHCAAQCAYSENGLPFEVALSVSWHFAAGGPKVMTLERLWLVVAEFSLEHAHYPDIMSFR